MREKNSLDTVHEDCEWDCTQETVVLSDKYNLNVHVYNVISSAIIYFVTNNDTYTQSFWEKTNNNFSINSQRRKFQNIKNIAK